MFDDNYVIIPKTILAQISDGSVIVKDDDRKRIDQFIKQQININHINQQQIEQNLVLNEHDINLVMDQTNGCRKTAITALEAHDGDIVNAIISINDF